MFRLAEAEELCRARVLRDERRIRDILVARDDDVAPKLWPAGDQQLSWSHDEVARASAERANEDPARRTATNDRRSAAREHDSALRALVPGGVPRGHVSVRQAESLIASG